MAIGRFALQAASSFGQRAHTAGNHRRPQVRDCWRRASERSLVSSKIIRCIRRIKRIIHFRFELPLNSFKSPTRTARFAYSPHNSRFLFLFFFGSFQLRLFSTSATSSSITKRHCQSRVQIFLCQSSASCLPLCLQLACECVPSRGNVC